MNTLTRKWNASRAPGLALLTLAIMVFSAGASAQRQPIVLNDLASLVELSAPQVSPDGKRVLVVASRPNYKENRHEREIVLVDVTTRAQRVLTFERSEVTHPRWSPDASRVSFLDTDDKKKPQIYILPMNGGDPVRITNAPEGVAGFAWSPDGKEIAFATQDEPPEKSGEEKHNKSFEVGDNVYLAKSVAVPTHLWLVPADGGAARRLTSGAESVSPSRLEWSPEGKSLLFVTQPTPHSGQAINASVKVIDVASANVQKLVGGFPAPGSPSFSPDGRNVAFTRMRGAEPFFNPAAIFMLPASGGKEVLLTGEIDRELSGNWLPGGKAILVTGPDLARYSAWVQPLGGAPRKLDLGPVDPTGTLSISPEGAVAFIGSDPQRPAELYFMRNIDSRPERLTDFNATIASRALGRVETMTWEGPDGFEQNGVVIYPPDFTPGRKYPLVLNIHGGPMSTSIESFGGRGGVFNHSMAARGWIVFMPNYRGSNNMGQAFQRAVVNDAGEGPGRDVMSGIAFLKSRGIVDDKRIAVSGWSYGGYMTAWLTGNYQGWAAAVAGAAVTDWYDWYNLADMNVWAGFGLGGSPWLNDNAQSYWKQSPMAYAHKIHTPMLILSNTDDPRVTVTQSYKLYHALKDNKVPVQFIAYPIPGHFPGDPVHQRDVYRRWIDWIDRQFQAVPAP